MTYHDGSPGAIGAPGPGAVRRYAVLALVTAIVVVGVKLVAYALTGSVGLLSDAVESVINPVAAGVAV